MGGDPGAEVSGFEFGHGVPERSNGGAGLNAGEGEVWGVGAMFGGYAERPHGSFGSGGELEERFTAMDGEPENAGLVGIGKPTESGKCDGEGRARREFVEGGF